MPAEAATRPSLSTPLRRRWVTLQDELLLTMVTLISAAVIACAAICATLAIEHLTDVAQAHSVEAAQSVQAAVPDVLRGVGGVVLAALAVLLPIIYLLIARACAPLRRLSVAARNVANGRFDTVDIRRGDALGHLAASFNHMVERIAEQKMIADDANARLIEANLNLERKIADRTAAIQTASRRLESEIAEKEDFLRAVSHDLNAPLRNIDGMVTMLRRKHGHELPADVLHRLDRIKHNVRVETELIGEILELSRIKTRREEPEPVNLQELVWDIRGVFENDLREHRIDLVVESPLPTVLAEKARMRQVFQNLIDNAIKYMGDGPDRRITIGCRVDRDEAIFWVRDTGIGIPPEDAQKVFYAFRRGVNHANIAGKGVGLASVKSIIENYQGRIGVAPNVSGGSTFTFTINGQYLTTHRRSFEHARPASTAHAA